MGFLFFFPPDGVSFHRVLAVLLLAAFLLLLVTPVSPELPLDVRKRREGERVAAWCLMSAIGATLMGSDDPVPGLIGTFALLLGIPVLGLHMKAFWATRDAAIRARRGVMVPPELSGNQGLSVLEHVPGHRLKLRQRVRWWSHLYLLFAAVFSGLSGWALWVETVELTDPSLLFVTFVVASFFGLWLRDLRRQSQCVDFRRGESVRFGRPGQRRVLPWSDVSQARVVVGEVRPLATNEGTPRPTMEISVLLGDASGKELTQAEWIPVLASTDESPADIGKQASFLRASLKELWEPRSEKPSR